MELRALRPLMLNLFPQMIIWNNSGMNAICWRQEIGFSHLRGSGCFFRSSNNDACSVNLILMFLSIGRKPQEKIIINVSPNPVLIEFQCWNEHVGGMISSSKLHILKADVDSHYVVASVCFWSNSHLHVCGITEINGPFFHDWTGSEEGQPAAVKRTTVWMPLGNMADL